MVQKSTLKIVNVDTSISHDFVKIIFVFSCLHYLNCLPIIPKLSGLSIQSVYHKDTLSQEWTFQIKRTILTPGRDVFIIIDTDTFGFLTTIFVLTPSHPPMWKFLQIGKLENADSSLLCHDWKTQYWFLSEGVVRSNLHMYLNPRMSHDMQMRETTSLLCSWAGAAFHQIHAYCIFAEFQHAGCSFIGWLYLCGSTFDRSCGKWQKRKYCVICLDTLVEPKLNSQWHFCQSKNWSIYISYGWIIYFGHPWYCSSQPSMVHWLSSSIFPFCRLFVCPAMVTSDQISTFFNIYRHKSLVLTQFY